MFQSILWENKNSSNHKLKSKKQWVKSRMWGVKESFWELKNYQTKIQIYYFAYNMHKTSTYTIEYV